MRELTELEIEAVSGGEVSVPGGNNHWLVPDTWFELQSPLAQQIAASVNMMAGFGSNVFGGDGNASSDVIVVQGIRFDGSNGYQASDGQFYRDYVDCRIDYTLDSGAVGLVGGLAGALGSLTLGPLAPFVAFWSVGFGTAIGLIGGTVQGTDRCVSAG
jgi:hypothetical protein